MSQHNFESKEIIKSNFIMLLQENPIEKISVRGLTAKSNLCRSTFYLYFKDIYELQEIISYELWESLQNTVKSVVHSRNFTNTELILEELTAILELIVSKRQWYKTMLNEDKNPFLYYRFKSMLFDIMISYEPFYPHGTRFYHALTTAVLDSIISWLDSEGPFNEAEILKPIRQLLLAIKN